jgi:1-phosphofructokinase family hexose kinase
VTPNTGLDRVLFLPSLDPGRRHQATRVAEAMGGKGCDVSLVLRALGEATTALGLAAGATGRRMEALLRARGVATDFVWTEGETRLNTVLIETDTLRHTTICAEGLQATSRHLAALLERVAAHQPAAEAIAVCGSLPADWPPEWYARLVRRARRGGRPVVVDAAGDALHAALEGEPAAVKPNLHELESVAGGPLRALPEIAAAARSLLERGAGLVVVSLAAEGAIAVTAAATWHAAPPPVSPVNPAGAGDGMVAMIALGLARAWPVPEILRRAVATGSAITTTPGTAECPAELARELVDRVDLRRVE